MDPITDIIPEKISKVEYHAARNALNVKRNFYSLGSYWSKAGDKLREHAEVLSNIGLRTWGLDKLQNAKNNFENNYENLYLTNQSFDFSNSYVYAVIENISTDIDIGQETVTYNDPTGPDFVNGSFVFKEGTEYNPAFLLAIKFDKGIEVSRIYTYPKDSEAKCRTLINGIDFYQSNKYLWFNENVYDLFKDKIINYDGKVLSSAKEGKSLYAPIVGLNTLPCGPLSQLATNYISGSKQSARDFELMLNAAIGANILTGHNIAKILYIGKQSDQIISSDEADLRENAYYVLEDTLTKETFVIQSLCPKNFKYEAGNDLDINSEIRDGYVFDWPIKVYHKRDFWKNYPFGGYYDSQSSDFGIYFYEVLDNLTLDKLQFPADAVFDSDQNSDTEQNMSNYEEFLIESGMSSEQASSAIYYWIHNYLNSSGYMSQAEIVMNYLLTSPMAIVLSLAPLKRIWRTYSDQSEYYSNKFPTFASFITEIVAMINAYAPLGYTKLIYLDTNEGLRKISKQLRLHSSKTIEEQLRDLGY